MWRPWNNDSSQCNENEESNTKRKRTHLSDDAKQIILNVYNSLKTDESEQNPLQKTSELTKVPFSTVWKIIYGPTREKKIRSDAGRSRCLDNFEISVIRNKVYEMYKENIMPSVRILHHRLQTDNCEIECSVSSLHRVLRKIGFVYKKIDKRSVLLESKRMCELRHQFLVKIKQYRLENRPIVYLDETWYDSHDTVSKSWVDNSKNCVVKFPVSRGKRIIILHAGGDKGWVNDTLLLSAKNVKDSSLDYHDNMSSQIFEKWFENKLIPNLAPHTVIVMDNASYHSRQLIKIPNSTTKKSEIIEYLYSMEIYFEENYTKKELLEVVRTNKIKKTYVCDELANKNGHTILRLPPYYCVFNPNELIWSQLKGNVRRKIVLWLIVHQCYN